MHRIFVYGTLKQGFSNHDRIFGGYDIKITPAFTYGKLYDLGWYPAMTVGSEKVYGELIEFNNPEILKRVDYLEGFKGESHPHNYYERREVDVFISTNAKMNLRIAQYKCGGDTVKAWIYFLSVEQVKRYGGDAIKSGKWCSV